MAGPQTGFLSDDLLLDKFQHAAFRYFLEACNPANGLVADTTRGDSPSSIAVVGFALASYPVGVERGWLARNDAATRTLSCLRFFAASPQGEDADAAGHRGFYYHFLEMRSGRRVWQCELSPIDTAFLLAGILTSAAYFDRNAAAEREIRDLAQSLYCRVDWRWMQGEGGQILHGWKPESGFLDYRWEGYSEAMLLHVLAMASPTHPASGASYGKWTSTYQWESIYGYDSLYAGPLFIHQYSHAWLDLQGLQDGFMAEKQCDYFENSRRAALIHRQYALRNPGAFEGYGENCWGLSAGEGPGPLAARLNGKGRRFFDYVARGVPFGLDDGTIAPSAILASLPFAPDIAFPALHHICETYPRAATGYRLSSGFNPTLTEAGAQYWVSEGHFGLDQGIAVLMIENYRSRLVWDLMRACPYVRTGLHCAGFKGGWL